ncbi:MAG: DNA (cytosine-5-)-methyltransferase [Legionellales bacterium]|nr:DNA (cytosine-5-)-methyltransferase [Legionellales bacterium]
MSLAILDRALGRVFEYGAINHDHITTISLFSGCGGMDLGFKLSGGFSINWANDIDEKACETYKKNIGNHIVCGDIINMELLDIPKAELILGGFPCQDFSMIWKRGGIKTKRGNLYQSFVKIVSDKNPIMFIAENVKGLLTANNGKAIKKIIDDFSNTGLYGYKVQVHLVNFADYGVAQLRERVLIIGVRGDIKNNFSIPLKIKNKSWMKKHRKIHKQHKIAD